MAEVEPLLAGGPRIARALARRTRLLEIIGDAAAHSADGWAHFSRRKIGDLLDCSMAVAGKDLVLLEDAGRIVRDVESDEFSIIGFKLRLIRPRKAHTRA